MGDHFQNIREIPVRLAPLYYNNNIKNTLPYKVLDQFPERLKHIELFTGHELIWTSLHNIELHSLRKLVYDCNHISLCNPELSGILMVHLNINHLRRQKREPAAE